jgi:hypothetical protein
VEKRQYLIQKIHGFHQDACIAETNLIGKEYSRKRKKICPKCGVEGYPITANFSVFHGSEKIPLQEKEYRKQ